MAKKRTSHRKASSKEQLDPRLIIVGAVVLIVAAVILMLAFRDDGSSDAASDRTIADDFTLETFQGQPVSLSDFKGRYVLVNFWASWCPPCKAEMPGLQAYHQKYRDDGFTVLAVNTSDDPVAAQDYINANGYTFPVVLDDTGNVFQMYTYYAIQQYGGSGLPTSYLIGPDGELVKVWKPGAISPADLERDVTPLLRG